MIRLVIHADRCKDCGLCVAACPQGHLAPAAGLNAIGYHPVGEVEGTRCTGCGFCVLMCPDQVLELYRVKEGGDGVA